MESSKVQKVGVVVNQNKRGALALLEKIRQWLSARGIETVDTILAPIHDWLPDVSLVICLGGDGTLLSAAGKIVSRPVPIMGVNLGSLGFMTEVRQEEVYEELDIFLAGKAKIEERLMLKCTIVNEAKNSCRTFSALNDIVVSREGLTRLVSLSISVNDEKLTCFSGDGVIIATPTGSTAYSLSAGGAVVHPKLKAILITPICPHAISLRPLVLSSHETISIRLEGMRGERRAVLTVDGQEDIEVDDATRITVTKADFSIQLVASSKRGYLQMLKENFKLPE